EKAVATAATMTGTAVVDFHVGPVFPDRPDLPGKHRYLVEFAAEPPDPSGFAAVVDNVLCELSADYLTHRKGNLNMGAPQIWQVASGGFAAWMRSRGLLGGQHKVPRMDNTGQLTEEIRRWLVERQLISPA